MCKRFIYFISFLRRFVGKGYIGDIIDFEAKTIYVAKSRATVDCILTERKKGRIIAKAVVGFLFPDPPLLYMDDFPYDPQSDKQ